MSLLSQIKSFFTPVTRTVVHPWLRGEDTPAPALLTSAFQQSAWVYACITTLAENISAIPFRILEKHDRTWEPTDNADVLRLFNQPHPHMDRFAFWELIVSWLCLRGEAFVYPLESSSSSSSSSSSIRRVPTSLLILNPDYLHEIIINGELAGWRYSTPSTINHQPSTPALFLPNELLHIKLPNPFHFWRGMSPLTVAYLAAQTDYAAAQFMKGAMLNNADTGLIVTTEEQILPDQKEQFLAALRERKRAAGTADRPLFLWGGARIEKPSISAVDLQFLDNRKWNRQELCAIFKVPQELLGFTEDANRSVSESARLNFIENRIAPLCKRLEAAIQPLLDRFQSSSSSFSSSSSTLRAEFHLAATPVMQAAQRTRVDTAEKLFGLGVPMNHVNEVLQLQLPRLDHGDRTFLNARFRELPVEAIEPTDSTERLLNLLAHSPRASVLDCGSPLPLSQPALIESPSEAGRLCHEDAHAKVAAASRRCSDQPFSRSKLSRALFEQRARILAALAQSAAANETVAEAMDRVRSVLNQIKTTESTESTEENPLSSSVSSVSSVVK